MIQKSVETPLARKIMAGEVPDGSSVRVSTEEHGIVFTVTLPEQRKEEVLEAV